MNNIHEKDWADDSWCGHTGMDNSSGYCVVDNEQDKVIQNMSQDITDKKDCTDKE